MTIRFIFQTDAMPFLLALARLRTGQCAGIRPAGVGRERYLVPFRKDYMQRDDFALAWADSDQRAPDMQITATQFCGDWNLVVVDHRSL